MALTCQAAPVLAGRLVLHGGLGHSLGRLGDTVSPRQPLPYLCHFSSCVSCSASWAHVTITLDADIRPLAWPGSLHASPCPPTWSPKGQLRPHLGGL